MGAEPGRSQSPHLCLLEDRRQGLDRLTAVAAAPGAVAVVQEERCAGSEEPAGAFDDRRCAGLGRIDDAAVPAAKAVAEAADGVAEPGAAHSVRCPKEAYRGSTRGGGDSLLGRKQPRAHSGWGAEGEQPVIEAVAGDLVAVREELPEQLWVVAGVFAEDEEGGAMATLG